MLKAHKIALDPTNVQATKLACAAGCARKAYNWALREWGVQYEACKADHSLPKPSQYSLRRELNAIKRELFPYMLESTKCAPQEAIIDLGRAFQNFFAGRAAYPKPRKKFHDDSFRVSKGFFKVQGKHIRVPNIGWIRMREEFRWPDSEPVSATFTLRAGRWFVALNAEVANAKPKPSDMEPAGVDVGTREAVVSDATRVPVPDLTRRHAKRLRRLQQSLARKPKGSRNRAKTRLKIARLHARIADERADWQHKTTTMLADKHSVLCVEDLNVKGMSAKPKPKPDPEREGQYLPNGHTAKAGLNKSVLNASFFEFRRQLEYKTKERETCLVVADQWFPSSKLCHVCGVKTKRLKLSQRAWTCRSCGTRHDRDFNAACNLAAYAKQQLANNAESSRCQSVESSGLPALQHHYQVRAKPSSVKQELSIKVA
ncbi:MAG: transposase [Propionibacteriaceae bacterium]|nr:transposase [Propionibacteriaceae bacterium]